MRPGFITAMTAEALTLSGRKIAPGEVVSLRGGALMTLGGIGRSRAAAASSFLLRAGADALISWGGASGLAPGVRPGMLILPERIISTDGFAHRPDPGLYAQARIALSDRFAKGSLAESPRILSGTGEKEALFRSTGALAADMESAAIAEAARLSGVPFLCVRVIIDPRNLCLPNSALSSIDACGEVRPLRFLARLVRRPGDITVLIRLAGHFRLARRVLYRTGRVLEGSGWLASVPAARKDRKGL